MPNLNKQIEELEVDRDNWKSIATKLYDIVQTYTENDEIAKEDWRLYQVINEYENAVNKSNGNK